MKTPKRKDPSEIHVWGVPALSWTPDLHSTEEGWPLPVVFREYPTLSRICPDKRLVYVYWRTDTYIENILTPCGGATYNDIYEAALILRLST